MKQLMKNDEFVVELAELIAKHTVLEPSEVLWVLNHTKSVEGTMQIIYHCHSIGVEVRTLTGEGMVNILVGNLGKLLDKAEEN